MMHTNSGICSYVRWHLSSCIDLFQIKIMKKTHTYNLFIILKYLIIEIKLMFENSKLFTNQIKLVSNSKMSKK